MKEFLEAIGASFIWFSVGANAALAYNLIQDAKRLSRLTDIYSDAVANWKIEKDKNENNT